MFPAEIFDTIGDFLYDDRHSLLACGLCRPLLPSTRYHLFSELSVQLSAQRVTSLTKIIKSTCNTISPYVQRVVFNDLARWVFVAGVSDIESAIRKMPRVLSMLPAARCMRISNTDFEHVPQEVIRCLVSYLHSFVNLELHSLHFYRFSEFADLVCSLPMLERVELKRLTWTHNGRGVSNLGRVSSHVEWHILELRHGKNLRDLAEWLGAHNPTPIIRSFYYDATSQSEVYHLRNLLRKIAPSLRYLQVSFPVFADNRSKSDTLRDFIDLQECTSLRSLRYKHILLTPDDAVTTMISPWVSQILSQIPSDSLEDVGFELMLPNSGDETCLKELDWSGISSALSRKEFRYLRSIQFSMSAGTAFNSACAANYILDRMPSFKHALRKSVRPTRIPPYFPSAGIQ
ncbi:hypothetical protein F5876DRAFT_81732 [Lentinula aff. lateritia]|uniref:Uncharacterized protein n=1 Tax=Lentinula aff. lateritia TaxID=2804960 RepID=A0ACC1TLJ9_9AGAR|nr:hypothetical protein F5876DRAFT_81732 [Lentinula aff. lateritia]